MSNKQNLSFVINIAKILKLNLKTVIKTTNKFKGLNYRQQVIYEVKKILLLMTQNLQAFIYSPSARKL